MTRSELDARVLAEIGAGIESELDEDVGREADESRFESLALALFRHQFEHNEPYRRICRAQGVEPADVSHWREIPAVPTGAFKEARLACFRSERTVRVFRSSGSTTARRGELHLDTLELYEASVRATFGAWICPEGLRLPFLVLAPSPADAPDSSLSCMFEIAIRAFGAPGSRYLLRADGWNPAAAIAALAELEQPAVVAGTAFAFVHLVDALAARGVELRLPAGTRALETGGFKGRSRELSRAELHQTLASRLGLPLERIVNQYGMCELASQFYEPTLQSGAPTRTKRVPPWVRTRVVDPETLADVPAGEVGALVHYDLASTGSVLAVQTSDAGRIVPGGFEVMGRLAGAEARGCSLAAEALLAAS